MNPQVRAGQGSPRFWLGLNPNFAQIVIVTKTLQGRERVKARLDRALAEGALPEARTRLIASILARRWAFRSSFGWLDPIP
jgi:hypothetical protein